MTSTFPAPEANVPTAAGAVLDHVGLFVPDMAAAARALERLGFCLTPATPQRHRLAPGAALVPAGTANRLAILGLGYIEVLTTVADTPIAAQLRAAIDRYPGLHLIAFGSGDAEISHGRLSAAGFAPQPVIHLERTVETAAGEALARFSVVRVPPGTMAEGRVQHCQHHTPATVWQPRWLEHPNRAVALADIVLAVDDPAEAAARFGRFAGRAATRLDDQAFEVGLARGRVVLMAAARLARALPGPELPGLPFMAACAVRSADLARTRAWLDGHGIALASPAPGVLVARWPEAIASTMVFLGSQAAARWFMA